MEVIDRVLQDKVQLADIKRHLGERAALFSKEIFVRAVRGLFDETMRTGGAHA